MGELVNKFCCAGITGRLVNDAGRIEIGDFSDADILKDRKSLILTDILEKYSDVTT